MKGGGRGVTAAFAFFDDPTRFLSTMRIGVSTIEVLSYGAAARRSPSSLRACGR